MHPIILDIVESYDLGDANVVEHVDVLVRVLAVPVLRVAVLNWAHEGHELARDDPVEVSVLNTLIVLVLLHVERAEVVPSEAHSILKSLQAVKQSAIVEALTLGRVSVVAEKRVVWLELGVGVLRLHFEDDDHEGAHQEGTIHDLVSRVRRGAVVEDPILREVLVAKETSQLTRESVDHGEVKRAEILVEGKVCQIVVYVEEERILVVLWRLEVRDPEQLV